MSGRRGSNSGRQRSASVRRSLIEKDEHANRFKKKVVREQSEQLLDILLQSGDSELAKEAEWLAQTSYDLEMKYFSIDNCVFHMLMTCSSPRCVLTNTRSHHADQALRHLGKLESDLAAKGPKLESLATRLIDAGCSIGPAVSQEELDEFTSTELTADVIKSIQESARELLGEGAKIDLRILQDYRHLFSSRKSLGSTTLLSSDPVNSIISLYHDYISGYPFDFLHHVSELISSVRSPVGNYYAASIMDIMRSDNREQYLELDEYVQKADGNFPLLIMIRSGAITVPAVRDIEYLGELAKELHRGDASSTSTHYFQRLSKEGVSKTRLQDIATIVGNGAWSHADRLIKKFGETAPLEIAEYLEHKGDHCDLSKFVLKANLGVTRSLDVLGSLSDWELPSGRPLRTAIKVAKLKAKSLAILLSNIEYVCLAGTGVLQNLLDNPKRDQWLQEFNHYLQQGFPGRATSYLYFSVEGTRRSGLRETLSTVDDLLAHQALALVQESDGDWSDYTTHLWNLEQDRDRELAIRSYNSYDLVCRAGQLLNLQEGGSLTCSLDLLDQIESPLVCTTILRHTALLESYLESSAGKLMKVQSLNPDGTSGIYREIQNCFATERDVVKKYPSTIYVIGDRIRDGDLDEIQLDLESRGISATIKHKSQGTHLGDLSRSLKCYEDDFAVLYYVPQTGHSHSLPLKHITRNNGGQFVELNYTNKSRIAAEIEKLAE
jgi:hypothetical protein